MNTWFHGSTPIARFDGKSIKPLRSVTTEDGTVMINDPELGAVRGRTRDDAEAEISRRKGVAA